MRSRLPAATLSVATAAALMLALSGCGLISQAADALQGKTDVFSITVGDCVNDGDLEATEITSVEKPSCDEPHDNEVNRPRFCAASMRGAALG